VVLEHHTRVILAVSQAFLERCSDENSKWSEFLNFIKIHDKNTPVSHMLVGIRVYGLTKKKENKSRMLL
jgi:hypothetical protein